MQKPAQFTEQEILAAEEHFLAALLAKAERIEIDETSASAKPSRVGPRRLWFRLSQYGLKIAPVLAASE